jgi:hypothetical protein
MAMDKRLSVLLIAMLSSGLIFTSLTCISTVQAESSITKPSVPEFTLRFVDNSYDVPPTFSTDPYTGKSVMAKDGYHVENKSIEVTIKNQPFTNYKDSQGNNIMLFYDVRWRGHFEDYWHEFSSANNYLVASSSLMDSGSLIYPNAPSTMLSYTLGENHNGNIPSIGDISAGGQVDFQVQAFIGYYTTIQGTPDPLFHRNTEQHVFTGEASGWSKTQTITIDDGISTTTPNTTPSQSSPTSVASVNPTSMPDQSGPQSVSELSMGLDWVEVAVLMLLGAIVALLVAVVVLLRGRRHD